MITAKRKKLKEKEKRARERVRKIKAKRVKAKEKAKIAKVKRKKLKEKEKRARERVRKIKAKRVKVKRKAPKYLRHKSKSSDLDEIFNQAILEELLGKERNVKGITAAILAARTKKRNPHLYYKSTKLIGRTQKEKDQHKQIIDRNKKQAGADAAKTRKRKAAKKGKLRR